MSRQIADLQEDVNSINARLAALENDVSVLGDKAEAQGRQITQLLELVTQLQGQMLEITRQMALLQEQVALQQGQLTETGRQTSLLQEQVVSIRGTLPEHSGQLIRIDARVQSLITVIEPTIPGC